MAIKLGSTNFGEIYLGSVKIGEAYYGSTKVFPATPVDPYNPLDLPPYTIRVQFEDGVTPSFPFPRRATQVSVTPNVWDVSTSHLGQYGDWDDLLDVDAIGYSPIAVLGANSTGVYSMRAMLLRCNLLTAVSLFDTRSVTKFDDMFSGCSSLATVPLFDTSSATGMPGMFRYCSFSTVPLFNTGSVENFDGMFANCYNLTSVPLFNTSSATSMRAMFDSCRSLASVPLFNTSSVEDFNSMFLYCESLAAVPLFDTSSATDMSWMFMGCDIVESGALALYTQASTQATPPISHDGTFENCGRYTVTGAQELAQIPTSWGGTGA